MSSPARAKYRRLHSDSGAEEARAQLEAGEVRERSLQSVLCLAQQELELEESEHQVRCCNAMLLRMPLQLQPRGNIPMTANITFLEDSLGHYNKTSNISISIIFVAPPTGQLKNHVMEKGGT